MKLLKKCLALLLTLVLAMGAFSALKVEAKENAPAKPTIKAKSTSNGTGIKITIYATDGAQGYKIGMKAPGETSIKTIKTLEKDGTAKRTYTVKNLASGKYSFKVRAYAVKNGEKVWSEKSETVTVTLKAKQKQDSTVSDFSKAKTGDYIVFGSYEQDNNTKNGKEPIEWLVLSNDGSELFVVSKYALDCKKYDYYDDWLTTWCDCSLRDWLNDDFYNAAFSKKEQSLIKTTTLKNEDNPKFGTEGGNDTKDKVFLLSLSDIVNSAYGFDSDYSTYDIKRRCAPTAYAKAQGSWVYTGKKTQKKTKSGEGACYWWLRSPGEEGDDESESNYATYVFDNGDIDMDGRDVKMPDLSVRPALVINLKQ